MSGNSPPHKKWAQRFFKSVPLLFLLFLLFAGFGCARYPVPPKKINLVVRGSQSGQLLDSVQINLTHKSDSTNVQPLGQTNELGYLQIKVDNALEQKMISGDYLLVGKKNFHNSQSQSAVALNPYLNIYDLFLKDTANQASSGFKVADMHYHVSMRTHNLFGKDVHGNSHNFIPENINWHKHYKKIRVLYNGKWKKPYFGPIKRSNSPKWAKKSAKMRTLLQLKWVRPKKGNNSLQDFSQATLPHIREGRVFLAFNALSPFEHSIANDWGKQFAGAAFKSGAPLPWLRRIGSKKKETEHGLTHWENFMKEYELITRQARDYNHFEWRFLEYGSDLIQDDTPTVVNVIEGAHILQDRVFPHEIDYDLFKRSDRATYRLYKKIKPNVESFRVFKKSGRKVSIGDMVNDSLMQELRQNIVKLKKLSPRIHMVTVGHLSYNGMLGHAPAIDDGTWLPKLITRKIYGIRVSDDPQFQKQWKGIFFSVPGVNDFGKTVMRDLLSEDNGHRIMIDLKHSDYGARQFFYDSLMVTQNALGQPDTIRPICSHCAVTGYSDIFYSVTNDEYALLQSPSTTTFYSFSINIFDEEIAKIAKHKGIIGIPLEQRVLGGYINRKVKKEYCIYKDGSLDRGKSRKVKRWKLARRMLKHIRKTEPGLLQDAMHYTQHAMGVTDVEKAFEILCQDYISAEPFLQNLFYIIDKSNVAQKDAWKLVCIGSDLDGIIDPIDICPTASQYPHFRARLQQFIPIFFRMKEIDQNLPHDSEMKLYFADVTIEKALAQLFYDNLKNFSQTNFSQKPTP